MNNMIKNKKSNHNNSIIHKLRVNYKLQVKKHQNHKNWNVKFVNML